MRIMLILADSLILVAVMCAGLLVINTASAQEEQQQQLQQQQQQQQQQHPAENGVGVSQEGEGRISAENNSTTKSDRTQDYQRFLYYWKLHHEMRFDFKRIMEPCKNNTKWASYYYDRTPYLITSANMSGVELDIKSAGQYSRIMIESYSLMNTRKKVGGDSWRVLIQGVRSMTPLVMDNMDGTYEASFLVTEPGYYHVTLSLEYTLCDGLKDPPPRWFNEGRRAF